MEKYSHKHFSCFFYINYTFFKLQSDKKIDKNNSEVLENKGLGLHYESKLVKNSWKGKLANHCIHLVLVKQAITYNIIAFPNYAAM